MLIISAIYVTHQPTAIDDESRGVRNIQGVGAQCVMKSVSFGGNAVLVEQEHAGNGMLLQEFPRLPDPIPLFGGDEC